MEGLVLTGPVSNEEVRRRTFMDYFVLTPVGSNERAIEAAGLDLVRSEDRSDAVAKLDGRLRAARERYRNELTPTEGVSVFDSFQESSMWPSLCR